MLAANRCRNDGSRACSLLGARQAMKRQLGSIIPRFLWPCNAFAHRSRLPWLETVKTSHNRTIVPWSDLPGPSGHQRREPLWSPSRQPHEANPHLQPSPWQSASFLLAHNTLPAITLVVGFILAPYYTENRDVEICVVKQARFSRGKGDTGSPLRSKGSFAGSQGVW